MASTTNLGLTKIQGADYVSPDVFNDNYDKLDALGVDYVTERGISGDWVYEKRKSGQVKLYGKVTAEGSGGYVQAKAPFPFAFTQVYSAIAAPTYNAWRTYAVDMKHPDETQEALTKAIVTFWIRDDYTSEASTYKASVEVIGTIA